MVGASLNHSSRRTRPDLNRLIQRGLRVVPYYDFLLDCVVGFYIWMQRMTRKQWRVPPDPATRKQSLVTSILECLDPGIGVLGSCGIVRWGIPPSRIVTPASLTGCSEPLIAAADLRFLPISPLQIYNDGNFSGRTMMYVQEKHRISLTLQGQNSDSRVFPSRDQTPNDIHVVLYSCAPSMV